MAVGPNKMKYTINSLDRGLKILILLGENGDPLGLNEVSRRLGIDKSTTYRIMSTLRGQGFVEQDPETRKYFLGLKVIEVANLKLRTIKLLKCAKPAMEELMVQSHETVHLAIQMEGEVMYLDSEQYSGIISVNTAVGGKAPMHSSAVGKALLATMPSEEADRVLAIKGLRRFTDKTIVDLRELHHHLKQCREQGYALDDEETHIGVRCLAAAIFNHRGAAVAVVGISGPSLRMTEERLTILAHLVRECAIKTSGQLGFVEERAEGRAGSTLQRDPRPGKGQHIDRHVAR